MVSSEREISFGMEIVQTFWMAKLKTTLYTEVDISISALGTFNVLLHLCVCVNEWSAAHTHYGLK